MSNATQQSIRNFIETSFLFREGRDALGEEDSLIDAGLIDSTGILELVSYIENEFGLLVEDEEIVPENLDSIARIAAYVERKHASSAITAIAV
jgi:acyl carrier protein